MSLPPATDGVRWPNERNALQDLDAQLAHLESRFTSKLQQQAPPQTAGTGTTAPAASAAAAVPAPVLQAVRMPSLNAPATTWLPSSANVAQGLQRASSSFTMPSSSFSLGPPPGPAKSTWEADKSRALLGMEERLHKLQHQSQQHAAAGAAGAASSGAENVEPTEGAASAAGVLSTHAHHAPAGSTLQTLGASYVSGVQPVASTHSALLPPTTIATTTGNATMPFAALAAVNATRTQLMPPPMHSTARAAHQLGPAPTSNIPQQLVPNAGSSGVGNPSTWERSQALAMLGLEKEVQSLRQQLDQYARLDNKHRQQLVAVHARHADALRDAEGDAGRRLQHVSQVAARLCAAHHTARHLSRALALWRVEVQRSRRLRWAERVWDLRTLEPVLLAWHAYVQHVRRPVPMEVLLATQHDAFDALRAHARTRMRHLHLCHRQTLNRKRRLLHAWHVRTLMLGHKAALQRQAARHHVRGVLGRVLGVLWDQARWAQEAQGVLVQRLRSVQRRNVFKAWHRVCATNARRQACLQRCRQRRTLLAWHVHASHMHHVRCRVGALATVWVQRRRRSILQSWHATTQWRSSLRHAEQRLTQREKHWRLAAFMRYLWQATRAQRMENRRGATHVGRCFRGWLGFVQREQRNERVATAAEAARVLRACRAALAAWAALGAARRFRLHGEDMGRMHAYVAQLQEEVEEARAERFAALARARAYRAQCHGLQVAAKRGLRGGQGASAGAAAGAGLMHGSLQWQEVAFPPGASLVPPRMRHCCHWLPSLQPPGGGLHLHNPSADHAPQPADFSSHVLGGPEGSKGVGIGRIEEADSGWASVDLLVVFGGVTEDVGWLTDLHGVVITQSDAGVAVDWLPVPLDCRLMPQGALRPSVGWASCPAGPATFVVVGGFDGVSDQALPLLLFQVCADPEPAAQGANDTAEVGATEALSHGSEPRATPPTMRLSASVQLVEPRSGRTPRGRTDHTVVYHPAGRCLVVFGGYSSSSPAGGYMSDLWVYDMDSHAWWHPDDAPGRVRHEEQVYGEQRPSARRSHVAVVIGSYMYVHGGFDGTAHLSDVWRCDLHQWTWERIDTAGVPVGPRRAHAASVLEDRYLLISGGYEGSSTLLGDALALDTRTHTWHVAPVAQPATEVQGGLSSQESPPAPCALHTLTATGSSTLVQLGGCGALGPVNSVHLLQSLTLRAGQAAARQLLEALGRVAEGERRVGELQAQLGHAEWRLQQAQRHTQAMEERLADVSRQYSATAHDVQALREALLQQQAATQQAGSRAQAAEVAAAAAARKLGRLREAGRQVAGGASQLQEELMQADAQLEQQALHAQEQEQLQLQLQEQLSSLQYLIHQLHAERNLLHVQLSTANNEVQIMRLLMARQGAMPLSGHSMGQGMMLSPPRGVPAPSHTVVIREEGSSRRHTTRAAAVLPLPAPPPLLPHAAITAALPAPQPQQLPTLHATEPVTPTASTNAAPSAAAAVLPRSALPAMAMQAASSVRDGAAVPGVHGARPGGAGGASPVGVLVSHGVGAGMSTLPGDMQKWAAEDMQALEAELQEARRQLARERLRATAAEQELHQLQPAMQAEMAVLSRRLAQESAAAQAAKETSHAALQQLREQQLKHAGEVEVLDARLRAVQVSRWEADVRDPAGALAAVRNAASVPPPTAVQQATFFSQANIVQAPVPSLSPARHLRDLDLHVL